MRTPVVVTLPDELDAHVQHWAILTHREVPQLLTEALALLLTPSGAPPGDAPPVTTLSETEVLAPAQVPMAPQQGHRLDQRLATQRETTLTTQEQAELVVLMQVYQQCWGRQSEALAEAVRHGLRAPLTPSWRLPSPRGKDALARVERGIPAAVWDGTRGTGARETSHTCPQHVRGPRLRFPA
jgi:hypothetical protein